MLVNCYLILIRLFTSVSVFNFQRKKFLFIYNKYNYLLTISLHRGNNFASGVFRIFYTLQNVITEENLNPSFV